MMGYPKNSNVLTKVDYENLLSMPEYKQKAVEDLAKLAEIDDSKITVDQGNQEKSDLKQIDNPLPAWKRMNFKDKEEMITFAKKKLKLIEESTKETV